MNVSWKQQIDEIVQDWSQRHAPAEEHVEAIEERVAEALTTTGTDASLSPAARDEREQTVPRCDRKFGLRRGSKNAARRRRSVVSCAAAAAAIAVAAACWPYLFPRRGEPIAEPTVAAALPTIEHTLAELAALERLLAETERLFATRLVWLTEEGRRVQMGLAEEAFAERDSSPTVAIRVVVVRRDEHETAWAPVRTIDVIARSEAAVHLPDDDQDLFLWAYVLPDGTIAVDTDLVVGRMSPSHATASGVFAPGVPAMVTSRHADGSEYRVFQVANLLRGANG